jgi:putative heme iron utilization protein
MATLSDEQRRALRLLARHPDGCAEAVLLADGFHVGQLAVLVIDGFAKMYRTATDVDGRQKNVVWMEITEEGRKAITD